jgi:uncharacterized protein (TIGR04222 family)
MLDWFISIKGPDFLLYFWTLSIVAIFVGRWWMNRADGSKYFPLPSPSQLNAYEIAALREERKGIIHTALFNLWNADLIRVSGKNQDAVVEIVSSNNFAPKNPFEAMLYHFIAKHPRTPKDFFEQSSFHSQMDAELETIYQKLDKLHLRRNEEQVNAVKRVARNVLWSILGIGGTKLFLGFFYSRPVSLLVISLVIFFVLWAFVFSTKQVYLSTLGKRYLKELTKYFEWAKTKERSNFDPALRVAIFGIAGLAGFAMFYAFQEAFLASANNNSSSDGGGGGCGGGCGGSDGGGGGGCGGCGGGGD